MKNILVVCPTYRDKRELAQSIARDYTLFFQNYDASGLERIIFQDAGWLTETFDPVKIINEMVAYCNEHAIDGVISSEDYPGSIFASIIAQKAGLRGPQPEHVLLCQHKYYARKAQQNYVPEATPEFCLIDPKEKGAVCSLSFPMYLKPVKSFFSVGAQRIDSQEEFKRNMHYSVVPDAFLEQFNWFLKHFSDHVLPSNYVLAEDCLQGYQVTIEGYAYNGAIFSFGITDSIFYPGTIAFKRFEYPSGLSSSVQERMVTIAQQCMQGIGFDNGMFNIEMTYDPEADAIYIIEINPRMASQFADLHEKVDGINSYSLLLDVVTGRRPQVNFGSGSHNVAASCVLRTFEDKKVVAMPSVEEIALFYKEFPDARLQLFGEPGKNLSDEFQDGNSFRYSLIHFGGKSREDILEKFERAQRLLLFTFEPA